MSQALAAALAKLVEGAGHVAASHFTSAQRRALEELARKTGALRVKSEGRGSVYQVVHPEMLAEHFRSLRPMHADDVDPTVPRRSANIAQSRSSKGGDSRHTLHYLLVKAIGRGAVWKIGDVGAERELDLFASTEVSGAGVLALEASDTWRSDQPLWLVENQALFDRLDWMPPDAVGTIAYYAGQLPARLLNWLSTSQRASEVILFPDYDGVGILNYARLRELCAGPCSFWLMPHWRERLSAFGNNNVWVNTQDDFLAALGRLKSMYVDEEFVQLCAALSTEGLALEHEAVWLPWES